MHTLNEIAFNFYWEVDVASYLPALKMKEGRHGRNQSTTDRMVVLYPDKYVEN